MSIGFLEHAKFRWKKTETELQHIGNRLLTFSLFSRGYFFCYECKNIGLSLRYINISKQTTSWTTSWKIWAGWSGFVRQCTWWVFSVEKVAVAGLVWPLIPVWPQSSHDATKFQMPAENLSVKSLSKGWREISFSVSYCNAFLIVCVFYSSFWTPKIFFKRDNTPKRLLFTPLENLAFLLLFLLQFQTKIF